MLRDCTPVLLLASDESLARAISNAWGQPERVALYTAALQTEPSVQEAARSTGTGTVTLIYTSGTRREPKGVMLASDGIEHMLRVTVRELAKMTRGGRSEDRVFHYLPFCFAGSRIMLWSQLHRGNPMHLSTDPAMLQQELAT